MSGVRVVVAGASPIMGLGLEEALSGLGYSVTARVETADELVAAVDRSQPELVLVDLSIAKIIPAVATICSTGAAAPQVILLAVAEAG